MAEDDPDLKADLKAWREWNEKPVPLSAIRALVQQWREQATHSVGNGSMKDSLFRLAISRCADQLAALCPCEEAECADPAFLYLAALCPAPPEET